MEGFEDGDTVTELREIGCRSETGRTGADNGNFTAGRDRARLLFGMLVRITALPVGNVPFEPADSNRLSLFIEGAMGFTLRLLGANPAADTGKRIFSFEQPNRFRHVAFADGFDKFRDIDIDRTSFDAAPLFTLETAGCFEDCLLAILPKGNLVKITCSHGGRLSPHFLAAVVYYRHHSLLIFQFVFVIYVYLCYSLPDLIQAETGCFAFQASKDIFSSSR
jgi:hypothetical protein